jgi:hypothetical protein
MVGVFSWACLPRSHTVYVFDGRAASVFKTDIWSIPRLSIAELKRYRRHSTWEESMDGAERFLEEQTSFSGAT